MKQNLEDVLNIFAKVLANNHLSFPFKSMCYTVDNWVPKDNNPEPIGSHTYLARQLN